MTPAIRPEIIVIERGRALCRNELVDARVTVCEGEIADTDAGAAADLRLDARDLLVLPGIVDIHGDAFERQMMPRPGVDFPVDVALADSDRQAITNGMTTVFHAATWSWEPGLRGAENAHRLVAAIEAQRDQLAADTRFHLRHETFNLEAEASIMSWLASGRIDLLAFNDHMGQTTSALNKPEKRARMVERTGLSNADFDTLVDRTLAQRHSVPDSVARLAAFARARGTPMLSHDDETPEQRRDFRAHGVHIAEFPINEETAIEAKQAGEFIVYGAPNVVRGGSHTGWTSATEMIRKSLCSILASDYYYPAPLLAAFRLVADGVLDLPQAWPLISANPAKAAGLSDRGEIRPGARGDIILVDAADTRRPRVVGAIANGRLVHLADASRLFRAERVSHRVAAA